MPRTPKNIHPQIVSVDNNLRGIINFWHHFHPRKRGLPNVRRVEGRKPNQAVDSCFSFDMPIGIRASNLQRCPLQARLISGTGIN